jgi:hypothetical protein
MQIEKVGILEVLPTTPYLELINNLLGLSSVISGECCQFVNKELAPASYILKHSNDSYIQHKTSCRLFSIVLLANAQVRQNVSIYGCIDILILVYRLYHLIFSVPITKGSDN